MPHGKNSPLPPEQVRQQVDQIMDCWHSYPSFAALLDALMKANALTNSELSRQLSQRTNKTVSIPAVRQYRVGKTDPSYALVEDLLATNILHLDPSRILPAQEDRPAGDQRVALFTAAGLIEVTPASIREWNQEVLSGHSRLLHNDAKRPCLRWGDLMSKLLSFQLQGGRQALPDITAFSSADVNQYSPEPDRISTLLRNNRPPSPQERKMLYRFAGLADSQIAYIENGIAAETIPIGFSRRNTPFAETLTHILDKLAAQGINQMQLALHCTQQFAPGAVAILPADLSAWRVGRQAITLEKLRSLIAGLRQMGPQRLRNPVTTDEITQLMSASGFASYQLSSTTHEIIARIDDRTNIKSLLIDLRSAADLSLCTKDILREAPNLGFALPKYLTFILWEHPGKTYPSGQDVQELLHCYNHFIHHNGFDPLSEEEIAKVVAVAARDHIRWEALSHTEKIAERRPRPRRQLPSPSFDGMDPNR